MSAEYEPTVEPGFYEHFKGKRYVVLGELFDAEAGAFTRVAYYPMSIKGLPDDRPCIYERTIENFTEHVIRPELGYSGPRFWRIG